MKHRRHKLKKSKWVDGLLQTEIVLFESLEEALDHASRLKGHHIKIYNELNELVHSCNIGYDHNHHTYA